MALRRKQLAFMLATNAALASVAHSDCFVDNREVGWTGSLTFHCDKDTDLLDDAIYFDLVTKGSNEPIDVGSVWGLDGDLTVNQEEETVSIRAEKWWPKGEPLVAKAGESLKLSFSPSTDEFVINNFHVGHEPQQSHATVKVKLPEKPAFVDGSEPRIALYNATKEVALVNDANWGETKKIDVEFDGKQQEYHVIVDKIDDAKGRATPKQFQLKDGDEQAIEVSYKAPEHELEGRMDIVASVDGKKPEAQPTYQVKDAQGNVVEEGKLKFGETVKLSHLDTTEEGRTYTVELGSLSERGYKYKPKRQREKVTVQDNKTSHVVFKYEMEPFPSKEILLDVEGLPADESITLTLTNGEDNRTVGVKQNNDMLVDLPQDGMIWRVEAPMAEVKPPQFDTKNSDRQTVQVIYQGESQHKKFVIGYWENWNPALNPDDNDESDTDHYRDDIEAFNVVIYSFLTLDESPNPYSPSKSYWGGEAIYESMTRSDVVTFMQQYPQGMPEWKRTHNWMRKKVDALIKATHENNGTFIWGIGGWSDLTKAIAPDQVNDFVDEVLGLLNESGDGIDFDWEHLSDDPSIATQQRETLAEVLLTLNQRLRQEGMNDKMVGYTTRFNAFMEDSTKYGFGGFSSDGEGITIAKWLKDHGTSLDDVVDWVNVMAYDVQPHNMPAPGWSTSVYDDVFHTFNQYVNKGKIVMGFEPGEQANGGRWEGMAQDKETIRKIEKQNYGGSMLWAINHGNPERNGQNSQKLAEFSQSVFGDGDV